MLCTALVVKIVTINTDKIWFVFIKESPERWGELMKWLFQKVQKVILHRFQVGMSFQQHNDARNAYLAWSSDKRPSSGPVHEWIKRTRARFKYVRNVAKRNDETCHADALAANFDTGYIKWFWKCIKDYSRRHVAFSTFRSQWNRQYVVTAFWWIIQLCSWLQGTGATFNAKIPSAAYIMCRGLRLWYSQNCQAV